MKYYININQVALVNSKLDLKDAAILEYLRAFCSVDDKKIKQLTISENGIDYKYTWINFNHLIKEMPLLGIKQKASISERIKKIEKSGYIKVFRAPDMSIYIRLTAKIKELEFNKDINSENSEDVNLEGINLEGVSQNLQGVSLDKQGVLAKTNSTNNISINNNISNNNNIAVASATAEDISRVINLFKNVSPLSYKDWFANKTERKAASELLKRMPADKLEILITQFLPHLNVMPYIPKDYKAFKPSELLRNLDKILAKIKELQRSIKKTEFIK